MQWQSEGGGGAKEGAEHGRGLVNKHCTPLDVEGLNIEVCDGLPIDDGGGRWWALWLTYRPDRRYILSAAAAAGAAVAAAAVAAAVALVQAACPVMVWLPLAHAQPPLQRLGPPHA